MTTKLAGKTIGTTGFGLMGLTWRPKPQPIEDSIAVMKAALESGANFWNGGIIYGTPEYNSTHLLKAYFEKYPEDKDKVVISIKGGGGAHGPDGSPENLRREIETFYSIVGDRCFIDIYECARADANTPIETTVGALADLVKEGKIGAIGLSEVGPDTIRRAAKVAKITSVEVEFSIFSPDILTNDVAATAAELGIAIVGYSPLSRGFLTGQLRSLDDLPEGDMRRNFPRFLPENFPKNLEIVAEIEKIAAEKKCASSNVAIAWVKAHSGHPAEIIPIPGTTTPKRLHENMVEIKLSAEEVKTLDRLAGNAAGGRYPAIYEALSWGTTKEL
jgi:pyridoxine 4-dehydrogenase